MVAMRNKDDGAVCCIDELVLNWGEHISHLYYDQDREVEMGAFKLLDSINNSTGSHWGEKMFVGNDVQTDYEYFQPTVYYRC